MQIASACRLMRSRHSRTSGKGGNALDDILDGGVDGIGPAFDWFQAAVAMLDFRGERGVAELGFTANPFFEGAGFGDQDFAGDEPAGVRAAG